MCDIQVSLQDHQVREVEVNHTLWRIASFKTNNELKTYPSLAEIWSTAKPLDLLSVKTRSPRWMNGILSRQYHKASFLQFSLTSKRRRLLSENDFVSVIHVSLSSERLLSGVVLGGDCASAVSDEVEERDGFRREATFGGLEFFSPGWQTKASPSSEKKRIKKRATYKAIPGCHSLEHKQIPDHSLRYVMFYLNYLSLSIRVECL